MRADPSPLQRRLRLAGIALLIAAAALGAWACFMAADAADDTDGYRIVDGQAYAVKLADSTRELQQIERIGGKAAVWAVEFQRGFASLWQGRRLAWTLALLCAAVALLCWHLSSLAAEDIDR